MRSAPTAAAILGLAVSAFVPFGPHVLTHALELRHAHEHDGVAHEHGHDAGHHGHEFQPLRNQARISASSVQLPRVDSSLVVMPLPFSEIAVPAVPNVLSRSLDPPDNRLPSLLAAFCRGNRAPPTA